MDYDKFIEEWDKMDPKDKPLYAIDFSVPNRKKVSSLNDWHKKYKEDRVNSPSHYTAGSQEAIVTIEEAIEHAPAVSHGFLQAQVLKYLLRVWHKDNPLEDLKKAQWYLTRLIAKMGDEQ
jgi:hypothetical protein